MAEKIKIYSRQLGGLRKAVSDLGYFHVDADGNAAYTQRYKYVGNFYHERATALDYNDKHFHIKMNGLPAYTERYDAVYDFTITPSRICLALVMNRKNRCFHIDPDGNLAYKKTFDYASGFYNGLAVVRENKEYYFILPNGTPAHTKYDRFDRASPFHNGLANVIKNGREFQIFPDGTEKVDFKKKP